MKTIIIITLTISMLATGCTLSLSDKTPGVYDTTHQFIVEADPNPNNPIVDRDVDINVNESWYSMKYSGEVGGKDIWVFDTYRLKNSCSESHRYWMKGKYIWFPSLVLLPYPASDSTGSSTVTVSHYGELIWFVLGSMVQTGNGSVKFTPQSNEKTLIIHNLKEGPVSVTAIEKNPSAPQSENFSIIDQPEETVQLFCGNSIKFRVRWGNDDFDVEPDRGGIIIDSSEGIFEIELNGFTYQ